MGEIFLVFAVICVAIAAVVSMTPQVVASSRDVRIQRNVIVLMWFLGLYTFGLAMRVGYYLS